MKRLLYILLFSFVPLCLFSQTINVDTLLLIDTNLTAKGKLYYLRFSGDTLFINSDTVVSGGDSFWYASGMDTITTDNHVKLDSAFVSFWNGGYFGNDGTVSGFDTSAYVYVQDLVNSKAAYLLSAFQSGVPTVQMNAYHGDGGSMVYLEPEYMMISSDSLLFSGLLEGIAVFLIGMDADGQTVLMDTADLGIMVEADPYFVLARDSLLYWIDTANALHPIATQYWVGQQGYLDTEVDGSTTNEIQNLSWNQATSTVTIDGTPSTDATLTNFTTVYAGLVPAGSTGTTKFLREDGGWQVPSGTGYTAGYRLGLSGTTFYNADYWKNQDTVKTTLTGLLKATSGALSAITDNSSNWNTAYGWGNHASAGYLTSEVDGSTTNEIQNLTWSQATSTVQIDGSPSTDATLTTFTSAYPGLVPAGGSGTTKYLNQDGSWQVPSDNNTTYSAGYRMGLSETTFFSTDYWKNQDTVKTTLSGLLKATSGVLSTITDNSANWNTAYGWGNHADEGYLTTEVDGSTTNEIQGVDYTASTRKITLTGSVDDAELPLFSTTATTAGLVPGSNTQATKYLKGDGTWDTPSGAGDITGITFTAPTSEFNVSGSPDTEGDVSIALTWDDQTTNKVFASPNGSTGQPTFRALVAADIPALSYLQWSDTTGKLATDYNVALKQNISDTTTKDATRYWVLQQGYLDTEVDGDADNEVQNLEWSQATSTVMIDGTKDGSPSTDATLTTFTSAYPGLVPAGGSGTTKYLNQDGSWQVPSDANTTYTAGYRIGIDNVTINNTSYWGTQDSLKTTLTGLVKATGGKLTAITDNSSNWDAAYGWGDHSLVGYLTDGLQWSDTNKLATQYWVGQQGYLTDGLQWSDTTGKLATDYDVAQKQDYADTNTYDATRAWVIQQGYELEIDPQWIYDSASYLHHTDTNTKVASRYWVGQQGYLTSLNETDPVFVASAAYGIASGDITNWNAAYGWGDHSLAGYLTSETDPVFVASAAYGIASGDITNWNAAYGWGDHSLVGYLTDGLQWSDTNKLATQYWVGQQGYLTSESDPVFTTHITSSITYSDLLNWNAAYGWGDHASAGYLTTGLQWSDTNKLATQYWTGQQGYLTSESDPVFGASAAYGIAAGDITNWNAAYGWGDHSLVGYLKSGEAEDMLIYTASGSPSVPYNIYIYDGGGDGNGVVGVGINSSLQAMSDVYLGIVSEADNTTDSVLVLAKTGQLKYTSKAGLGGGTNYWEQSGNYIYPKNTTDSVAIGTTTPQKKLYVSGTFGSSGGATIGGGLTVLENVGIAGNLNFNDASTTSHTIGYGGMQDAELSFVSNYDAKSTLRIKNTGYVSVGIGDPTQEFSVIGDASVSDTLFATYVDISNTLDVDDAAKFSSTIDVTGTATLRRGLTMDGGVGDFQYAQNISTYTVQTQANQSATDEYNIYIIDPDVNNITFTLASAVEEVGREITIINNNADGDDKEITILTSSSATVTALTGMSAYSYRSVTIVWSGSMWFITAVWNQPE